MACDHQWQESGTSKKHDWVCSKCKILYTVLKGLDDDDIQTYVRPWVNLTDKEIEDAIDKGFAFGLDDGNVSNDYVIRYVRVIENMLRKKNT